jgi:hypothetical protein
LLRPRSAKFNRIDHQVLLVDVATVDAHYCFGEWRLTALPGRKRVDERRTGPISSSRHWRGALRTAANQSVSAVSEQPGQLEQRDQEVVERPVITSFRRRSPRGLQARNCLRGAQVRGRAANPLKRALLAACTLP